MSEKLTYKRGWADRIEEHPKNCKCGRHKIKNINKNARQMFRSALVFLFFLIPIFSNAQESLSLEKIDLDTSTSTFESLELIQAPLIQQELMSMAVTGGDLYNIVGCGNGGGFTDTLYDVHNLPYQTITGSNYMFFGNLSITSSQYLYLFTENDFSQWSNVAYWNDNGAGIGMTGVTPDSSFSFQTDGKTINVFRFDYGQDATFTNLEVTLDIGRFYGLLVTDEILEIDTEQEFLDVMGYNSNPTASTTTSYTFVFAHSSDVDTFAQLLDILQILSCIFIWSYTIVLIYKLTNKLI